MRRQLCVEQNVSRYLGPFRFPELLKELADVAPHRCTFRTIDFTPEHSDWYFYWGVPKLWDVVFQSSCTPIKIDDAWAFFGVLASELGCWPSPFQCENFLEATILAIIDYYRTGTKPAAPRDETCATCEQEAQCDLAYAHGFQAGWNSGLANDTARLDAVTKTNLDALKAMKPCPDCKAQEGE